MTDKVLIPRTEEVNAYISDAGYLVITQLKEFDEDQRIMIAPDDIERFIVGLQEVIREG